MVSLHHSRKQFGPFFKKRGTIFDTFYSISFMGSSKKMALVNMKRKFCKFKDWPKFYFNGKLFLQSCRGIKNFFASSITLIFFHLKIIEKVLFVFGFGSKMILAQKRLGSATPLLSFPSTPPWLGRWAPHNPAGVTS